MVIWGILHTGYLYRVIQNNLKLGEIYFLLGAFKVFNGYTFQRLELFFALESTGVRVLLYMTAT